MRATFRALVGFIGLLAALWLLPASPVAADEVGDERARELFDNGAILYDEGRYEDAVAAWKKAYELSEKPLLLFNIANAMERLGQYQQALDNLNLYRAFASASERSTLDRRIRNLEQRVEEQRAMVTPAYDPSSGVVPELTTRKVQGEQPGPDAAPFVLIGGGGAVAAFGGAMWIAALGQRNQAREFCSEVVTGTFCRDSASQHLGKDRTFSLIGDIGVAAGAAILGVGIVVLIAQLKGPAQPASAIQIIPSASREGGTLTLVGRF